jgi:rhodanese-related sulfurtransferase
MKRRLWNAALIILFVLVGCATLTKSTDALRMTKEELRAMLDSPNLVVIDVRYGKDWTDSDLKIKGAVREDPGAIDSWVNKYPKDKTLVFYCT